MKTIKKNGFPSRYDSKCYVCGRAITVGHYINWTRNGASKGRAWHANCNDVWGNQNAETAKTAEMKGFEAYAEKESDISAETTNTAEAYAQADKDLKTLGEKEEAMNPAAEQLYKAIQDIAGESMDRQKVTDIARTVANEAVDAKVTDLEKTVLELIESSLPKKAETVVTVTMPDKETVTRTIGKTHAMFNDLLMVVKASYISPDVPINVWITGPAGAGKTRAAQDVAKAFGLNFYFTGAVQEPFSLLGYMDANGKYVRTCFREAYEFGGVFLWDEVDGSGANAFLSFNGALANNTCAFPDRMVERHKDCIILAAANTYGLGATNDYVGRNKLDASSASRFVFLDWPYDEVLERELAIDQKFADRVIQLRSKAKMLGLKILITPRASYAGSVLLKAGIPQDKVERMVIKQGMTEDQWKQVTSKY